MTQDGRAEAPTIDVAISAYNAERWIAETLESVLAQTRPPHEVIVIDDGSTDRTPEILERFSDQVRVLSQRNQGVSTAFNRIFRASKADFVALCGADDLWVPEKLEWQAQTLSEHPHVDIAFGHARMFGVVEGDFARPAGTGVLDGATLARRLYHGNMIAAPSAVIRRALHERLGGFREDLAAEDYEFWLRSVRAGALFYYDPRLVLHYRRHGQNMSMPGALRDDRLRPQLEMNYKIHTWYADVVSRGEARRAIAKDMCDLGRYLAEVGPPGDARKTLRMSLRRRPSGRALVWLALLRIQPARRGKIIELVRAIQRVAHGSIRRSLARTAR